MPCDNSYKRQARIEAITKLKKKIADGQVRLDNFNGVLTLSGWNENRAGFCDECAIQELKNDNMFFQEYIAPLQNGQTSGFGS